jgi:hypothetical protein
MSQPDSPAPSPPRARRRALFLVVVALALCGLAVVVFKWVIGHYSTQAIAAALSAAEEDVPNWREHHRAARPVAPAEDARSNAVREELMRLTKALPQGWPDTSAAEDARNMPAINAFVLRKGTTVIDKLFYFEPLLAYPDGHVPPIRAEFETLEEVYKQLPVIPGGVELALPIDWKTYASGSRESASNALLQLGNLYILRAFLRMEEGAGKDVGADLIQIARAATLLRGDASIRGNLARQWLIHGGLRLAERWVARFEPSESELAAVQVAYPWQPLSAPNLADVLRQERAYRFERLEQGQLPSRRSRATEEQSWWSKLMAPENEGQQAKNKYLPMMNDAVRMAVVPRAELTERWRPWDQEMRRLAINVNPDVQMVCGWLVQVQSVLLQEHQLQARCEATCAALACERYRLKHGRWPEKEAELVPAFLPEPTRDPYTGTPLLFRRTGDMLAYYSPGLDLADHQGVLNRHFMEVAQNDVGMQVWLPAARKASAAPAAKRDTP